MAGDLISLDVAQARLFALAPRGAIVRLPLHQATGWLAEPLLAVRDQPFADLSAMDGYALGQGKGPWRITQTIAAECRSTANLGIGEAARIFTGAPLPMGANRIMPQEDAALDGDMVSATKLPSDGQWIRRKASDFACGDVLAPVGAAITPALLGLAAISGHASLPCRAIPVCRILATGSELIDPADSADNPQSLPSATGPMLSALLERVGGQVSDGGIVPDQLDTLAEAISTFEQHHHAPSLLLLTGGASVGDHDLVRPALEQAGWTIALHRIALKPGKPLMVAHTPAADGGLHLALGLPGNPVSAFVTALLFAVPLLRHAAGCPQPLPRHHRTMLAEPIAAGGTRLEYLRGTMDADGRVIPLPSQDSASLRTLAKADVLIRVDVGQRARNAGDTVDIIKIA